MALTALLSACSEDEGRTPPVVRAGVLPDQTREVLVARHTPLLEYLSTELGTPFELVIPDTYGDLLALFHEGKIDLAYFGGFTFVQANRKDGAIPVAMRDVDAKFTTSFLVRADDPARSLSDLQGRGFAFGSELSTSGHLMPRFFLKEKGITPEAFFGEVKYSGAHDKTARWVCDGVVALGAVNSRIAEKMFDDGRLAPGDTRILWKTPPYPDYVWAVRPDISDSFRSRLLDAFLKLSGDNPDHRAVLESALAGNFLPAFTTDFAGLARIVDDLKLIGEAG